MVEVPPLPSIAWRQGPGHAMRVAGKSRKVNAHRTARGLPKSAMGDGDAGLMKADLAQPLEIGRVKHASMLALAPLLREFRGEGARLAEQGVGFLHRMSS